ncbi:hypothetical protein KXD93_22515 [Mucilaginibacter sp. BJC16-A38]|uniref:hypothetical protein n=1 Tax=Mucilaginibacter phenanthrenivorans TaxID=1234842 RepID=UPI002157C0C4|nr:hypothetical protein [Mucilaginibacter phenanthrenivorans]MCR8560445.1 hypothetical protein [Mucilaginibacter phenanthrenivorans]
MAHLLRNNGVVFKVGGHVFRVADRSTFLSTTFSTNVNALAIRFDPDPARNRFLVGRGGAMDVYDAATLALTQTITGFSGDVNGICFDQGNNRVFVFTSNGYGYIVDGVSLVISLTVRVGSDNFGNICYDPVSDAVWAPSYYGNKIYVLAAATLTITATITDGPDSPGCVSMDPVAAHNRMVLGNYGGHTVITYDRSTLLKTGTYASSGGINDIFWDPVPQNNRVFFAKHGGALTVADAQTFAAIEDIVLGSGQFFATIDPVAAHHRILAAYNNYGISVVQVTS